MFFFVFNLLYSCLLGNPRMHRSFGEGEKLSRRIWRGEEKDEATKTTPRSQASRWRGGRAPRRALEKGFVRPSRERRAEKKGLGHSTIIHPPSGEGAAAEAQIEPTPNKARTGRAHPHARRSESPQSLSRARARKAKEASRATSSSSRRVIVPRRLRAWRRGGLAGTPGGRPSFPSPRRDSPRSRSRAGGKRS